MALLIQSPSFEEGGAMASRYTCEGEDLSPALSFSGVPAAAQSLVLVVDDPDAPDPAKPQRTFVHWLVYNLPPTTQTLAEHVSALPSGAREGVSDFGRTGYGGPCPPIGTHRYFFKLYALDTVLTFAEPPRKPVLLAAMEGHVLDEAALMGTYKLSHTK